MEEKSEEEKKDSIDIKAQLKILRNGVKEERKKNAQLQTEIVEITTKLKRTEEELAENKEKNIKIQEQLTAEKMKVESLLKPTSKTPGEKGKEEKKKEIDLNTALNKAKGECEKWKRECELTYKRLDEKEEEQKQLTMQFKKNIENICGETSKMKEDINNKDNELVILRKKEEDLRIANEKLSKIVKEKEGIEHSKDIEKVKGEMMKWKREAELLGEKLEQTQEDQNTYHNQFKKTLEDLNQKNSELEVSLRNKESGLMKKEGEIGERTLEIAELKKTIYNLTEENRKNLEFIEKMKANLNENEQKMKKMIEETETYKKEATDCINLKEKQEQEIKKLNEIIKSQEIETSNLKKKLENLSQTELAISRLNENMNKVQEQTNKKKIEIETTLVNAGKLNESFKTLKECFDKNNNLMQTHLSQIDSLKKSIREANEKISELEEFKRKSQTQQNTLMIENLTAENTNLQLKKEKETCENVIKDLNQEKDNLIKENEKLNKIKEEHVLTLQELVKCKEQLAYIIKQSEKTEEEINKDSLLQKYENQIKELSENKAKMEKEKEEFKKTNDNLQNELAKKTALLGAFQEDIVVKKSMVEDMSRTIIKQDSKIAELNKKISDGKARIMELDALNKFYPAAEIRDKMKLFVTIRFVEVTKDEFALEKYTLKEKKLFNILEVNVHRHETVAERIIILYDKPVGKFEVFETQFAEAVYKSFCDYRKRAENVKVKSQEVLTKKEKETTSGIEKK